jgi:hypothetical protein
MLNWLWIRDTEWITRLKVVNQNCYTLSGAALLDGERTSSILQLAIHSKVEMLNVACPIKSSHHLVIIDFQFLFLHNVFSRLTGNLTRPLSPRCCSICCSTTVFDAWKSVLSSDDRVASSVHIWPWLSGRTKSSRLARSLMCKCGGSVSILGLASFS